MPDAHASHDEPPRLRSRRWFDDPHNPAMTALYVERYCNFGLTREELQGGKPIIGIAQTGSDLVPHPRRYPRRRRHPAGIPGPPDPGNRQAPNRSP